MISRADRDRVRRFATGYFALFSANTRGRRGVLLAILVLSVVGAVGQGGSAALIGLTINAMQDERFSSVDPVVLLAVAGAVLLVVTFVSAWATFAASRKGRAIARETHERLVGTALTRFDRPGALDRPGMPRNQGELTRVVMRDCTHSGNALETILRNVEPILRVVVSMGILFSIDAFITAVMLPMFLVLLPVIRALVYNVHRDSNSFFEGRLVDMLHSLTGSISRANAVSWARTDTDPDYYREHLRDDPEVRQFFDENDRLQLVSAKTQFGVGLTSSIVLVAGLLLTGYLASSERLSWGTALTFLLAFRTALMSLRTVVSSATTLGLYFPAVERLQRFIAQDAPAAVDSGAHEIVLRSSGAIREGLESVALLPGDVAALQSPSEPSRTGKAAMLAPLTASAVSAGPLTTGLVHVGIRAAIVDEPLGSRVLGPASDTEHRRAVESALAEAGVADELEALAAGWDTVLDQAGWENVSRGLRLVLLAATARRQPGTAVAFSLSHLTATEDRARAQAIELLSGKILLVVHTGAPLRMSRASVVIVCSDTEVLGIGDFDWYDRTRDQQPEFVADAGEQSGDVVSLGM